MKRTLTPLRRTAAGGLAVCLLLAALAGCALRGRPLLWYQACLDTAVLSGDGHEWEIALLPEGFTVTLQPSGIAYRLTDAGTTVSAGDLTVPVTDAMAAVPKRLAALFSLREEDLLDVRTDGKGAVTARYDSAAGEITVHFGEGGLPASFETAAGVYTVTRCRLTAP